MSKQCKPCETIGEWSIEYRTRNNHVGYKVWILFHGREVMSLDERGFRQRDSGRVTVPEDIRRRAYHYWSTAPES